MYRVDKIHSLTLKNMSLNKVISIEIHVNNHIQGRMFGITLFPYFFCLFNIFMGILSAISIHLNLQMYCYHFLLLCSPLCYSIFCGFNVHMHIHICFVSVHIFYYILENTKMFTCISHMWQLKKYDHNTIF